MPPTGVCFLNTLLDFKQPSTPGDTIAFERGRDRKADRLVRPAFIRHNKVCVQRVESALPAFNRSVEAFQVDCDIGALLHASAASFPHYELSVSSFFFFTLRAVAS